MKSLIWFAPFVAALPNVISAPEYATVKLAEHPDHHLLVRPNGVGQDAQAAPDAVCVGASPGYTGYLVKDQKHFYFTFFESKSKPATDPLVLWTNGGPGCSSLLGALQEHGPCILATDGTHTVKNEKSWINTANVIYFEQPLGVGFSFDASTSGPTNSTFIAAEDLLVFLKLWYAQFPEHRQQDFHLSGESYAGHYLPMFADTLLDYNSKVATSEQMPIKSVIIGNGQYNLAVQELTYFNMTCTDANGVGGRLLDQATCEKIRIAIPECGSLYQKCQMTHDSEDCSTALKFCQPLTQTAYRSTKRSLYDVRHICPATGPCDAFETVQTSFMNDAKVRAAFGADDRAVKTWQACNETVNGAFWDNMDPFYPSSPYLTKLLDKGLPFLIYHGIFDVSCNYVGAEQVLNNLAWHGADKFVQAAQHPVKWSGGAYWESDNLRYSRVNGAGHFVPTDQPDAALELLQSWLEKRALK